MVHKGLLLTYDLGVLDYLWLVLNSKASYVGIYFEEVRFRRGVRVLQSIEVTLD